MRPHPAHPVRFVHRRGSAARLARRPCEVGSATVIVVAALAVGVAVVLAIGHGGVVAVDAARARSAADAAALAGAADGRPAAGHLAAANGGRLTAYAEVAGDVVVVVRVGSASARARARQEGRWCDHGGRPGSPIPYTRDSCLSTPG